MVYTVGIIGAGENARDHAKACTRVPAVRLEAVCDISPAALDRFGTEFGVTKRYASLDEMLRHERLDIAIVSAWGPHHATISNAVAASGKARAILVEKPISTTAAECEGMIAAARSHDVLLTEGFKFRYHPQHLQTKAMIDDGRIGELRSLHCTLSSPLVRSAADTNWRFDRVRGGGSVFDTASYLIHFSRFLAGVEPSTVYAMGHRPGTSAVERSASIVLSFPGDVTANLTSSYEYGYCQSTSILGTRGWIRMDLPFDQRSVRDVEFTVREELPAEVHVFHDNFDTEIHRYIPVNQFELQLRHICDCLERREPLLIPAEFSLGNMRVIDAVLESMRSGRPVDLSRA